MAQPSVGCVYSLGRFVAPAEASVSAFDRGFLFGDGVFESLRTYGGRPFRLNRHLRRLAASMDLLALDRSPETETLQELVFETLKRAALPEAYVRITVTRGVHIGGFPAPAHLAPTVVIAALPLKPYPAAAYERGIAAAILWARSPSDEPPPSVKTTSFQRGVIAKRRAAAAGADEGLYVDGAGHVTEGTVSNVFLVAGDTLYTPPPEVCLAGITRDEVLRLAAHAQLRTVEAPVPAARLFGADEVFVTSSLAELLPVVQIDGRSVGGGRPGETTLRLLAAYRDATTGVHHG